MKIQHPTALVLDILVEAGARHNRLHDAARKIAAAYSEANESDSASEPAPERER